MTKNLVLAGIGLLHLVDDGTLSDATLPGNFLVPATPDVVGASVSETCAKGLKEMNPLVDVSSEIADPRTYVQAADDNMVHALGNYNTVLAFDMPATIVREIDERCASLNIPFCACTSRGVSGWIFVDPQRHEYIVENSQEDEKTGEVKKQIEQKTVQGVGFEKVVEEMVAMAAGTAAGMGTQSDLTARRRRRRRSTVFDVIVRCAEYELQTGRHVSMADMEPLKDKVCGPDAVSLAGDAVALADYLEGACVPAVNAVLGGIMANDVIKLVSKKGALGVDRLFCYSAIDDAGWTM